SIKWRRSTFRYRSKAHRRKLRSLTWRHYLTSLGGTELQRQVANPFFGKISSGTLSSSTVQRYRLLLPYPQYTGITQFRATVGDSNYHALIVKVDKRADAARPARA